jgi:8-oxo-dGTP diphosphatase
MKRATLAVIVKNGKILLQKKAAGLFGEGKWNGAGGKLEKGETYEDCMLRELKEELNIKATILHITALLDFYNLLHPLKPFIRCAVFLVDKFEGIPSSSKEGEITWFSLKQIPYTEMWPDDSHWLPMVLAGYNISGTFMFDENMSELLRAEVHQI